MDANLDRLPEADRNRVICKEQVAALLGYHPATIDRLVADGRFIAPFRVGERKLGWRYGKVIDFIAHLEAKAQRTEARDSRRLNEIDPEAANFWADEDDLMMKISKHST